MSVPEIVEPDFAPHWKPELSNDLYHADKTAVSSSVLKLFHKSAASVYCYYMTTSQPDDEPEHFRLGRAIHTASLEPKEFAKFYVKEPIFTGFTKDGRESENSGAAKEKRKKWRASLAKECMVLSEKEYLQVEGMINAILDYPDAVLLMNNGIPEISGYYRDTATGIKCKIRPDLWSQETGILLDVKSCVDSSPWAFQKSVFQYKYHLSMAMYSEGIYQITGKKPEMCVFVAIEKKPPYEIGIYICAEKMLEKGYEEYNFAMKKLKHCLETNTWPRRQNGMEDLDLPEFAYKKEELIYE